MTPKADTNRLGSCRTSGDQGCRGSAGHRPCWMTCTSFASRRSSAAGPMPGWRRCGGRWSVAAEEAEAACGYVVQQPQRTLRTASDRYSPHRQRKDLQRPRRHELRIGRCSLQAGRPGAWGAARNVASYRPGPILLPGTVVVWICRPSTPTTIKLACSRRSG